MSKDSIELIIDNHVGYIYLNRPKVFNSFNREMAFRLQDILDDCRENSNIRSLVLSGHGKAFCAGQDLQEIVNPELNPGLENILKEHYNPIISRIRNIEKPVIAAVNGVAAGAGANIALACDVVVASENASFIQAFSKIGLIPDSAGTYFLPRLIGFQKASALAMLGDKVIADEAERLGMIYKVFSDDEFRDSVKALADKLAAMPTKALALTKSLLNRSMTNDLDAQLELEMNAQIEAGSTYDFKEGVTAFIEKRKPNFKGR
ncbi:MAG: enoyl-CoA hydratase/isomerase family protein [Bacteroidia bacterium]|nr:enoyl-CoA hydratase/isomerase family protein [Bacteroidia bacterium]MBT8287224.1 enoyl-CoA hydratase/isomerase family protein [Bacteroidia bacterium]NNK73593.1 2-(1,2-epoxy-1,2-dihydrophenyl)acetyl-CoA isomerase [Flavobacteriaceae bacterium]